MTRSQVKRLSGRLAMVREWARLDVPHRPDGTPDNAPGAILGMDDVGDVLIGWHEETGVGWSASAPHFSDCLFGDLQGCSRFWWVRPEDLDVLPKGAG